VAAYRLALSIYPYEPWSDLGLGKSLLKLGRGQEAAAHLSRALFIHPDHPAVLSALGEAYLLQDRPDEAEALFERLAVKAPEMAAESFLKLGTTRALRREYQRAVDAYHRALELKPGYVEAQRKLDAILIRIGLNHP
jgi:tetratricopeptide (TPR) repeat protein